jgi:hypothetical protein
MLIDCWVVLHFTSKQLLFIVLEVFFRGTGIRFPKNSYQKVVYDSNVRPVSYRPASIELLNLSSTSSAEYNEPPPPDVACTKKPEAASTWAAAPLHPSTFVRGHRDFSCNTVFLKRRSTLNHPAQDHQCPT